MLEAKFKGTGMTRSSAGLPKNRVPSYVTFKKVFCLAWASWPVLVGVGVSGLNKKYLF